MVIDVQWSFEKHLKVSGKLNKKGELVILSVIEEFDDSFQPCFQGYSRDLEWAEKNPGNEVGFFFTS